MMTQICGPDASSEGLRRRGRAAERVATGLSSDGSTKNGRCAAPPPRPPARSAAPPPRLRGSRRRPTKAAPPRRSLRLAATQDQRGAASPRPAFSDAAPRNQAKKTEQRGNCYRDRHKRKYEVFARVVVVVIVVAIVGRVVPASVGLPGESPPRHVARSDSPAAACRRRVLISSPSRGA